MLFDLRGKRKRFIQAIYLALALLLGGSLVLFGIGGDASGGLGNLFGLDPQSGGTTSGSVVLEEDIERAESTLESDPDNREALLALSKAQFQVAQEQLERDEQGLQTLTEGAIERYEEATDAWERFLRASEDAKGKLEDPEERVTVATLMFQAYSNLAFARQDPVLIQRSLDGAVETAQILAEERPNVSSYADLATYAYLAGKAGLAEEAEQKALAEVEDADRDRLKSELTTAKRQGRAIQAQLEASSQQAGGAEGGFQNPLQGLGSEETTGSAAQGG